MESLKLINVLIGLFGEAFTLGQAKTWLEVEENAQSLRDEGHEDEVTNP